MICSSVYLLFLMSVILHSDGLPGIYAGTAGRGQVNTSIFHIFERLNTGGTPLKAQEIRNCVFRGGFVKIFRELNQNKNWRSILGTKAEDSHQKDIELLLRIFSLSNGGWKTYEKPMKQFLNVAMEHNKAGDTKRVDAFKTVFPKVAEKIIKALGDKPFHLRGPLNASALDAVVSTLVDHSTRIPKDLDLRFKRLVEDQTFIDATFYGTSDVKVLTARFETTVNYLID